MAEDTFDELVPGDIPLVEGGDSGAAETARETDGSAETDTETDGESKKKKKDKNATLHTLVAISIATVSVLGAIASWRIESHSTAAADSDQSAVAATITDSRLIVESRAIAQQSENAYFRYIRLVGEAAELDPAGCPQKPLGVLGFNAFVVCELHQAVFQEANDPYVSANGGTYDVGGLTSDLTAERAAEEDALPAPYEAEARTDRHAENRLLFLTLVLVLSLALLTFAHLAHKRKLILRLAIPAWALMVVSAVLLTVWEV
jgi:hypothetical protein